VHFARVLCQNTPFLLFDEPFSAQDVDGVGTMLRALKKRTTLGHTVVVVLHDLNLALGAFESLIVMQNGQILGHGTPDDAISALITVYGQTLQFERGDSVRVALPVWR
jgi:iron complex transport system ATP-binding protein